MTAPEASSLPYIEDGNIKKEETQKGAASSLENSSTKIKSKSEDIKKMVEGGSLGRLFASLTPDQQKNVQEAVDRIGAIAQEAGLWKEDNYADSVKFEKQILEKALEYSRSRSAGNDQNYLDALGNKYDQAVGASEFFDEFAKEADSVKEISEEDKRVAAYHLWEKINANSNDLKTEEGRAKLLADKSTPVTQEDIDAILDAGLIADAASATAPTHDPKRFMNPDGSVNQEKWNQAVLETAAGMLEKRMLEKIQKLGSIDTGKGIYEKAEDVYRRRTGKKEGDTSQVKINSVGNPDIPPDAPIDSLDAEAQENADVEPGVDQTNNDPNVTPQNPDNQPIDSLDADALQNADVEPGVQQPNNPNNNTTPPNNNEPIDSLDAEQQENADVEPGLEPQDGPDNNNPDQPDNPDAPDNPDVPDNPDILPPGQLDQLRTDLQNASERYLAARKVTRSVWRNLAGGINRLLRRGEGTDQTVERERTNYLDIRNRYLAARALAEADPITVQERDTVAYDLAERVKREGRAGNMATPDTRRDLISRGIFTQDEMDTVEASNLLNAQDIDVIYNRTGFNTDDEWDKGVAKVAAGLLEARNVGNKSGELLVDEILRLSERELGMSLEGNRFRIMSSLQRLYRNPLLRFGVGMGLNVAVGVSVASLNPAFIGVALGTRAAWGAIGLEGALHTGQDVFQGTRGSRRSMSFDNIANLSNEELQNRMAAFHENRILKGQRMEVADTGGAFRGAYDRVTGRGSGVESAMIAEHGVRFGSEVVQFVNQMKLERNRWAEQRGEQPNEEITADILEAALANELSNQEKDRREQLERTFKTRRWLTAVAGSLALTGLTTNWRELFPTGGPKLPEAPPMGPTGGSQIDIGPGAEATEGPIQGPNLTEGPSLPQTPETATAGIPEPANIGAPNPPGPEIAGIPEPANIGPGGPEIIPTPHLPVDGTAHFRDFINLDQDHIAAGGDGSMSYLDGTIRAILAEAQGIGIDNNVQAIVDEAAKKGVTLDASNIDAVRQYAIENSGNLPNVGADIHSAEVLQDIGKQISEEQGLYALKYDLLKGWLIAHNPGIINPNTGMISHGRLMVPDNLSGLSKLFTAFPKA